MHRLLKTVNKFNGNLCFVGATDFGDLIFECDRDAQTLSYDTSTKLIYDVCLEDSTSYLVAFSDTFIGQYLGGVLDETHINTGLNSVDKIVSDSQGNVYILNRVNNQLVKGNMPISANSESSSSSENFLDIVWTFDLPDYILRYDGQIIFRESDKCIVFYNNANLHIIRDDITKGTLLNSLQIGSSGYMKALISGEFNSEYTYVRARTVTGKELDQSSSSSSYSSSSSSSKSSSSSSSSGSSSSSSSYSSSSSSSYSSSSSSRDSSSSSSSSSRDSSSSSSSESSSSSNWPGMIVSGAGSADANGTYSYYVMYEGKPSYKKVGEDVYIYWDPGVWYIENIGTGFQYYKSTDDTITPDLVITWTVRVPFGTAPVPTVIQG